MQIQLPVFYTFPQEEITTSNLFYLPQSYENFYFFQIPVEQQSQDYCSSRKSEQFLKLFEEQLLKISIKYLKKIWTAEDDEILVSLKKEGFRWSEISQRIPNSNPQTCKRRFFRLKSNQSKWPKELEKEIKRVCENDLIKWEDKMRILSSKFPEVSKYSKKMIKERYLTYLDDSIDQKPWTIQEDIQLISLIQKGVNRWRMISHAMPGRSQLHLKNRYYGCLRAIQKKIEIEIENDSEKRSENSNLFSP